VGFPVTEVRILGNPEDRSRRTSDMLGPYHPEGSRTHDTNGVSWLPASGELLGEGEDEARAVDRDVISGLNAGQDFRDV